MKTQKLFTWVTAILEHLFFAGAIFGWPNIVPVLEEEQFFTGPATKQWRLAPAKAATWLLF